METIFTRAPFLYPSGVRRLLCAPQSQCLIPHTQTRFVSRRIRRKTKPTKPDKLASSPDEELDNVKSLSQKQPSPKSPPAPTVSLNPPNKFVPKQVSQRPDRSVESPERKSIFHTSNDRIRYYNINSALNCYWNSVAPSEADLAAANDFFTSPKTSAKFLIGPERFIDMPRSTVPEVAFLGRSNVGKSSLLNAVFAKNMANTSRKPGRTRSMNMYGIGGIGHGGASLKIGPNKHMNIEGEGGLVVVDTPGYGYASQKGWGTEVLKYLTSREQLRRVYLLVDAEHGLKDADKQILKILHSSSVPYQVVLSKADKVYIPDIRKIFGTAPSQRTKYVVKPHGTVEALHEKMNQIREIMGEENVFEMLACSSEVKIHGRQLGIDALRRSIMNYTLGVREKDDRPPLVDIGVVRRTASTLKANTSTTMRIRPENPDTISI